MHSLVTFGTPHAEAPGPAFRGVEWCNREPLPFRGLAVGAVGSPCDVSGDLTRGAYAFCDPTSDGTDMDGDRLTPTFSSPSMKGNHVEKLVLEDVTHFPGGHMLACGVRILPEQTRLTNFGMW